MGKKLNFGIDQLFFISGKSKQQEVGSLTTTALKGGGVHDFVVSTGQGGGISNINNTFTLALPLSLLRS